MRKEMDVYNAVMSSTLIENIFIASLVHMALEEQMMIFMSVFQNVQCLNIWIKMENVKHAQLTKFTTNH
jgi:hypothetical protein